MFYLVLNDMRSPKIENRTAVAYAESENDIMEFLEKNQVEPYVDVEAANPLNPESQERRWHKSYTKGSVLEWCNPPYPHDQFMVYFGSKSLWEEVAREQWRSQERPDASDTEESWVQEAREEWDRRTAGLYFIEPKRIIQLT